MNEAYCDLATTTSNPETTTAIHDFAHELVSHGNRAGAIIAAADADADSALANAYAAAAYLTLMTRQGQDRAAKPLATAIAQYHRCNSRERQSIAAITAWHLGDTAKAARIFRGVVEDWPHDLVAMKLCQILELSNGDGVGMLRTSAMAAAVAGRSGYALGLHAFALEQAGENDIALRLARRAIDLNPGKDPWAEHAVAHVFMANDQPVEGRSFLHAHAAGWDRCSSFMFTHNWWHLALFERELGNLSTALDLLRGRVWGVRKGHSQDQINAIALLARLDIDGVDAPEVWDDIASHVELRSADRLSDFLDLHYLYALAKAGRDGKVRAMLENFAAQSVAGALAHGIAAHAKGEYRLAASQIAPVRHRLALIGGSNVQRQLFEVIFLDSVIRCRETGPIGRLAQTPVEYDVAA
jgi:tetratricopeptide (TPR) repeat protein